MNAESTYDKKEAPSSQTTEEDVIPPANPTSFPILPVLVFILLSLLALAFMVIPEYMQSEEMSKPIPVEIREIGLKENVYSTWRAVSYIGRCHVTAMLVDSRTPYGRRLVREFGDELTSVRLTFNNTRGIRPVRIDTTGARFYDFIGRSIPCTPLNEAAKTEAGKKFVQHQPKEKLIKPGEVYTKHMLFFRTSAIATQMDRLYALQFIVDDKPYNLQGKHSMAEQEAVTQERLLREKFKAKINAVRAKQGRVVKPIRTAIPGRKPILHRPPPPPPPSR